MDGNDSEKIPRLYPREKLAIPAVDNAVLLRDRGDVGVGDGVAPSRVGQLYQAPVYGPRVLKIAYKGRIETKTEAHPASATRPTSKTPSSITWR